MRAFAEALEQVQSLPPPPDPRLTLRIAGTHHGYLADPDTDPIQTAAWKYADRASYGANSYPRTGVALRTLQGLVGDAAFYKGMRYFARTLPSSRCVRYCTLDQYEEGAGEGGSVIKWPTPPSDH